MWWAPATAGCSTTISRTGAGPLELPRERARARALEFDWERVCDQFVSFLVPARAMDQAATPIVGAIA